MASPVKGLSVREDLDFERSPYEQCVDVSMQYSFLKSCERYPGLEIRVRNNLSPVSVFVSTAHAQ